jgi:hypothetical protein
MSDHRDSLIDFVNAVSGDAYLKVEETLTDGYVRLLVSEAERRQAKHDIRSFEDIVVELLRNARDAHAQRIFLATGREKDSRILVMLDDGIGIPADMQELVFEPRVTSKLETMIVDRWGVHGRGMALFSVRSNVSSARIVASAPHKGTSVSVLSDTETLPERADQSSWPHVERDDAGILRVTTGPHNIVRRVLEFACEHPEIDLYLGSPAEILATLVATAQSALDRSDLLFCDDISRLPVWQRPAAASDATDLVEVASGIGIEVSERTAHRVLAGELATLDTVLAQAQADDEVAPARTPDIYRDRRGLKIDRTDLTLFKREVSAAFDRLAGRYYLHLRGEPKVTVGKDAIRIRFDVDKED